MNMKKSKHKICTGPGRPPGLLVVGANLEFRLRSRDSKYVIEVSILMERLHMVAVLREVAIHCILASTYNDVNAERNLLLQLSCLLYQLRMDVLDNSADGQCFVSIERTRSRENEAKNILDLLIEQGAKPFLFVG